MYKERNDNSMIKSDFVYLTPESLSIAYEQKKEHINSAYLAGGTDYIPLLKYNLKEPSFIISLDRIPELKRTINEEKYLYIGAMTTLREVYENKLITELFPSLSSAARKVASPQLRNAGTIGGNILQDRRCLYFNQSGDWRKNIERCYKVGGCVCLQAPNSDVCRALYYSDIAPVLISLDAEAELFDGKLIRIPIKEVIKKHVELNGILNTHDYILTGFYIPYLQKKSWLKFEKYSLRDSLNFAIMNVGVRYSQKADNPVIKIIVGAVSPKPLELTDTENMIIDRLYNLKNIKDEIAEFALTELTKKSHVVGETGISIKVKRNNFKNILNIIDELTLEITGK
jgi:CO/xanthine dehydrogenase FAD-binding subunit